MKNEMCLALIILATLPASAQRPASQSCSVNGEAVTALAQDYAARVDGLLREVHASLQNISERLEAGDLTPEQARNLKLATTRDMISRLDAMSAVYDVRLESKDEGCPAGSVAGALSSDRAGHGASGAAGTISVEELRQERTAAVATQRADEVTR